MVAKPVGSSGRRIVLAAGGAFLASMLVTVLIVTGYAFGLGFQARGAPDPKKISAFAHQVGPTWGPALLALFTVIGGWWVARRGMDPVRHGALVGVIAGAAGLLPAWPLDLRDAAVLVGVVAAGWVGGILGRHGRNAVSGSSAPAT